MVEEEVQLLMVSGAPASHPDPDVGTRRMAKEYCSAFLDRAARIRLRLPTLQSILSLYGDLTKLLYLVRPVELKGSMLPK